MNLIETVGNAEDASPSSRIDHTIRDLLPEGSLGAPYLFSDNSDVTGAGLDELRQHLGLSVADMTWLFGMTMGKWSEYTRVENAHRRVPDETVEIFARLLDRHPEYSPLPAMPTMKEMRDVISEVRAEPLQLKQLAVFFGRQGSAGHRWITQEAGMPPIVPHLGRMILNGLEKRVSKRQAVIDEWEEIVRLVGRRRGVADVFEKGNWVPD